MQTLTEEERKEIQDYIYKLQTQKKIEKEVALLKSLPATLQAVSRAVMGMDRNQVAGLDYAWLENTQYWLHKTWTSLAAIDSNKKN